MSGYLVVKGPRAEQTEEAVALVTRAATATGLVGTYTCSTPGCVNPTILPGTSLDISKLSIAPAGSTSLQSVGTMRVFAYANRQDADSFLANVGSAWLADKVVLAIDV